MSSKLFQSICAADAEGVRQCLDTGADPDERGTNGETPLMVAAREGYVQIIDTLLAISLSPADSRFPNLAD